MAGKFLGVITGAALILGAATAPAYAAPAPRQDPAPQARAATATAAPRPAIWLLEDADTRIYLFGTTHLFERGFQWRSPRLDAAIAESDELVMETPDEEGFDGEAMMGAMTLPKPVPIMERVSPDRREALARVIARSDIPEATWDEMTSFAAAFIVMAVPIAERLSPAKGDEDPFETAMSGAEEELGAEFRRRGLPISGVETMQQQFDFFRNLSPDAQRAFLDSMIDASAMSYEESGIGGDTDWSTGNLAGLEAELSGMPPELYDALLTRRNRAWTEWLTQRMERPGTVFFAVGALHLVGPDSVQAMLGARGMTARRID